MEELQGDAGRSAMDNLPRVAVDIHGPDEFPMRPVSKIDNDESREWMLPSPPSRSAVCNSSSRRGATQR